MEETDYDLVWTDATDPSSDSDTATTSRMSDKSEESSLESKYKKQLHEQSHIEPELKNGFGNVYKKKKKCKDKNNVLVKSEPESDLDFVKKKTKADRNASHSQNSTSVDNSYLDLKVKEEDMASQTSSHKKLKKNKKARRDSFPGNNTLHTLSISESDTEQNRPKKKKHKNEDHKEAINGVVQELFSAEDTIVGTCNVEDEDQAENEIKKSKKYTFSELVAEDNEEPTDDLRQEELEQPRATIMSAPTRLPRISDRILFEDDSQEESTKEKQKVMCPGPYKLKQFVKSRGNLQPSKVNYSHDLLLTKDDEFFLVDCPSEVEMTSLVDITVPMDNDCRLKLGGHKYEGHIYLNEETTPLFLFSKDNNNFIQSFPCKGTINLRKRLPKAHFVTDNIIENERDKFIPLPDTKCRHPLFGPDYKKAIKVPTAVRERLQAATAFPSKDIKKKKKKKREKVEDEDCDGRAEESRIQRSGKRTRRGSTEDEPASKRLAWDDERAIEHNLFQF